MSSKLSLKRSRRRTPSTFLLHVRLREPILASDQLELRPLFLIPEFIAYESFDCTCFVWKHDLAMSDFVRSHLTVLSCDQYRISPHHVSAL